MPTYEYVCDACKHEFEKFHSILAAPEKVCPKCRKRKVRRKIVLKLRSKSTLNIFNLWGLRKLNSNGSLAADKFDKMSNRS